MKQKEFRYQRQIGNTVYTVIVKESDTAKETPQNKIKKLIERGCDSILLEQKQKSKIGSAEWL